MERLIQIFKSLLPSSSSWKAVMLSIGAATVFWIFNSLNQQYTASINYPIDFEFPREKFVIMEKLPDKVQINVSGGGWNIFRKTFAFNLVPVLIRLEQPANEKKLIGGAMLPIISEQLGELRVNYVVTDTLNINIERKKSKSFTVVVDSMSVPLMPEYRITSAIETSPSTIIVSGPESIISQLPPRLPMAIEEKRIDENFDKFVEFKILGYNQPFLEIIPAEINVKFNVDLYSTFSRKVPLIPVNFPDNVTLEDSVINIVISMSSKLQNELIQDSIIVEVDFQNLQTDSTILPNLVRFPDLITTVKMDTLAVKVKYE